VYNYIHNIRVNSNDTSSECKWNGRGGRSKSVGHDGLFKKPSDLLDKKGPLSARPSSTIRALPTMFAPSLFTCAGGADRVHMADNLLDCVRVQAEPVIGGDGEI
jgi:hypothetical protein